jgi:ABC-3C biological conflict system middle component
MAILRPTKYSHPDRTVVNVAFLALAQLRKRRLVDYSSLLGLAKRNVEGGGTLFLPAMNLLYALGLVEYRSKIDSFEYVGS